jgi:hypothetical protein
MVWGFWKMLNSGLGGESGTMYRKHICMPLGVLAIRGRINKKPWWLKIENLKLNNPH